MIFSIQRFLEDHFSAAGWADRDQYAISLANLYDRRRARASRDEFLKLMHSAHTGFFKANRLDRSGTEERLLALLDRSFKKKVEANPGPARLIPFERGLAGERRVIRRAKRRSMRLLLERFRHAVESAGIDMFWKSRLAGKLKPQPESIAQAALTIMLKGVLDAPGKVFREYNVGVGYVDIGVVLSTLHVLELKVLKAGVLVGPEQLDKYLRDEGCRTGWLVVVDARRPTRKTPLPTRVKLTGGRRCHVISIDINPTPPSRIAA
jgi:hypothetical protein